MAGVRVARGERWQVKLTLSLLYQPWSHDKAELAHLRFQVAKNFLVVLQLSLVYNLPATPPQCDNSVVLPSIPERILRNPHTEVSLQQRRSLQIPFQSQRDDHSG